MSEIVPADDIERIVGAKRHAELHLGGAFGAERTVYILHSKRCRDSGVDLRWCPYSVALDKGIRSLWWDYYEDCPVVLDLHYGELIPGVLWTGESE